ncbi:MAG: hypothetical protein ACRDDZ_12815 [Marinifilaceae bacterium]
MKRFKKRTIRKGIVIILSLCYIGFGLYRCSEESDVIKLTYPEFNPPIYDFPVQRDCVANQIINLPNGRFDITSYKGYVFKVVPYAWATSFIYKYRKDKSYINAYFDLMVTLDSLTADSTRVIIDKINNRVAYGVRFWKSPFFQRYIYKTHEVYTPSIEEYDFLRYLGKKLGYLDKMPYTHYPPELSRKEIMGRFERDYFTEVEMFGNKEN